MSNHLNLLIFIAFATVLSTAAMADNSVKGYIWDSTNGFESVGGCDIVKQNSDDFNLGAKVLEINSTPNKAHKIADSDVQVDGTFWQEESDDGGFYSFVCGDDSRQKIYFIFDVFTSTSTLPIAQVGVNFDDSGILKSAIPHTATEAETLIAKQSRIRSTGNRFTLASQTTLATVSTASPATSQTSSTDQLIENSLAKTGQDLESQVAERKNPAPTTTQSANTSPDGTTDKPADTAVAVDSSVPVIAGGLDYVVCTKNSIVVKNAQKKTLFTAQKLESVKLVQGFGGASRPTTLIEVQFPAHSGNNIGWVPKQDIQSTSSCAYVKKPVPVTAPSTRASGATTITGLNDRNCCGFPTTKRASVSYHEGERMFRAGRDGGARLHAACDIYRPLGEDVVAVAPGTVILGLTYFYQGVYELQVRSPGGFISRYGEVLGKGGPAGVKVGDKVKMGQVVGLVGQTTSPHPMLHFELYSGTGSGPLTDLSDAGFERRDDLLNPTSYLQKWEQKSFGVHY